MRVTIVKLKKSTYCDLKKGRTWYPLGGSDYRIGSILRFDEYDQDGLVPTGEFTTVRVTGRNRSGIFVETYDVDAAGEEDRHTPIMGAEDGIAHVLSRLGDRR